jgi:hypothetical protein
MLTVLERKQAVVIRAERLNLMPEQSPQHKAVVLVYSLLF